MKDKKQKVTLFKDRYLKNLDDTLRKLGGIDINKNELINAILQIDRLTKGQISNSLELRQKIFENSPYAIQLISNFLKDRTNTFDSLKYPPLTQPRHQGHGGQPDRLDPVF